MTEGTDLQIKDITKSEARKIFSRTFLPFFIFFAVCYAAVFVIEFAVAIIFPYNSLEIFANPYFVIGLNVVAMYIIAFPVFLIVSRALKPKGYEVKLEKSRLGLGSLLVLLFMGEACMFVGNLIGTAANSFISSFVGYTPDNSVDSLVSETPLWLIMAVAVVIGPIIEEIMFRKILIDRLSPFGDFYAVLFSSVAFGLFHGNLYQLYYAALIGFILGYVYTRTRRIIYPIIIHITVNFLGSVVPMLVAGGLERYIEVTEQIAAGNMANISFFILYTVLTLVYAVVQYGMYIAGFVILIVWICKRKFKFSPSKLSLRGSATLEVGIINVGSLLFIFLCLILIAVNFLPAIIM